MRQKVGRAVAWTARQPFVASQVVKQGLMHAVDSFRSSHLKTAAIQRHIFVSLCLPILNAFSRSFFLFKYFVNTTWSCQMSWDSVRSSKLKKLIASFLGVVLLAVVGIEYPFCFPNGNNSPKHYYTTLHYILHYILHCFTTHAHAKLETLTNIYNMHEYTWNICVFPVSPVNVRNVWHSLGRLGTL